MKINYLYLLILLVSCEGYKTQRDFEDDNGEKYEINNDNFPIVLKDTKLNTFKYPIKNDEQIILLNNLHDSFLSNNTSLQDLLEEVYYSDQLYRDSVMYYSRNNNESKIKFFRYKMKEIDTVNRRIVKPIIFHRKSELRNIISKKAINSLWLVSVHNNDKEMIKELKQLMDASFGNGILDSMEYNLYCKYYLAFE